MVQKNAHFPCVKHWPRWRSLFFNNSQNYMHAFNETNIHHLINFTGKYELYIKSLVEFREKKIRLIGQTFGCGDRMCVWERALLWISIILCHTCSFSLFFFSLSKNKNQILNNLQIFRGKEKPMQMITKKPNK